jgi:glycopeptide antibiotics resistance protein
MILVLALGLILSVTLRSVDAENDLELVPFGELVGGIVHGDVARAREAVVGALGNMLLFVPLGVALALRRASIARVAATALFASAAVELVQLLVPGRTTSVDDVVFNVVGAVLGLAVTRLRERCRPERQVPAAGGGARTVSKTPRRKPLRCPTLRSRMESRAARQPSAASDTAKAASVNAERSRRRSRK